MLKTVVSIRDPILAQYEADLIFDYYTNSNDLIQFT